MGLTPAAVSHQVKEFEEQLGVRLFERAGRATSLTPAGETMHMALREALDILQHARAQVQRAGQARRLHISAMDTVATKWLLPRLGDFMRLHPDIDIGVEITTRVRDFRRDDIDVAFRWGRDIEPGTRADQLFEHRLFPVCSPKLIEELGLPARPMNLLDYKLIHVSWSEQGFVWPDWREWLQASGVDLGNRRPGMRFTETGHAIQAAIDGHGIAIGDACIVADDLKAGRLVRLFDLAIAGPPGFCFRIIAPLDTADTDPMKSFREWALAEAVKTMAEVQVLSG